MTVQHTGLSKRILCSEEASHSTFSVIAVAEDVSIQKMFVDMGADVSILAPDTVSTKDYLDAFAQCHSDRIFVFPNSSDGFLSAMQAKSLYSKGEVTVLNSPTIATCYAALPIIDFEEQDPEVVLDTISQVINDLLVVSLAKRESSIQYKNQSIHGNEFYSYSGKELLAVGNSVEDVAIQTIKRVLRLRENDVITVFYQPRLQEAVETVISSAKESGIFADFYSVPVDHLPTLLTVSFE